MFLRGGDGLEYPGSLHNHTDFSNFRLRDAISTIEGLIDYSLELGQEVIAFTEHETLANSVKIEEYYDKVKADNPSFKVIRGNEIYLTRNGLNKDNYNSEIDRYFHFILLAKDAVGHKQLRELSTRAWMRSYMSRGMRRVPTYYQDLEDIVGNNKGHIIASTACLGGQLPQYLLNFRENRTKQNYKKILNWCGYIQGIFGKENFFLEMQPSNNPDQIYVNKCIVKLSQELDIPYIITTDSHYIKEEEKFIHRAYLKSQNGEREVDEFYDTTYLMGTEEIEKYFSYLTQEQLELAYSNILRIKNMCEDYTIKKPLKIPQLPWKDSSVDFPQVKEFEKYIPNLSLLDNSDFEGDKLLTRIIVQKIKEDKRLQTPECYAEIDEELKSIYDSSLVNKTHWSSYFLNLQKIVDNIWEAGSLVGCGRGSGGGFLILYLLGITQVNPLWEKTKMYAWRFLNPARVSVLDVDLDVSGLKREKVLNQFRGVYGQDRVSNVLTLGTEKAKSAILTAARGLGINNDIAQYIASLIPSDRGIIRTLKQCYYGDKENDMQPVTPFVAEMNQYPELWKVASRIEGLICRVGSHAGGLIFVDEPFTESTALMRTPDGTVITQFDLHDAEKVSLIKYDLLSIEALDKIQVCLELLAKYGYIKEYPTLQETYEKALGIYNINRDNSEMWKMLQEHKIQSMFQMEKASGIQGIDKTKPHSVEDLSVLNSVIRLMAQEKNGEQPIDKYARFKNDISLWYKEMQEAGLTEHEQKLLEPILGISYGICESQEKIMMLVQIPECGGFDLNYADSLRKSIAKKNPEGFIKCEEEFFNRMEERHLSKNFCNYVWKQICISRGYSFNSSHTALYSLIGLQEMNLAYFYPTIFWNCANLIVESGAIEELDEKTSNYGKIAIAVNKIKTLTDTKISLIDINKSSYSFTPDVENNIIYFGLAGLQGVGIDTCKDIIKNRPYNSVEDFQEKTKINKTAMITLIKSGAFDCFADRKEVMTNYIKSICGQKQRITMQNLNGLFDAGLLNKFKHEKQTFNFYKELKKQCKYKEYFSLPTNSPFYRFYEKYFDIDQTEVINGNIFVNQKIMKNQYDKEILSVKNYIQENKDTLLVELNNYLFQQEWDKYAGTGYAAGEMESIGTYQHPHELINVDRKLYGISNFSDLPKNPPIAYICQWHSKNIPIFKTTKIIGTVIAKDDLHSTIYLLTPDEEVVVIRFGKDYYARYNKRISQQQKDGTKKVMEESFFKKGTLLMINGFRRDDNFVPKAYKKLKTHQLFKITEVMDDGKINFTNQRWGDDSE